MFLIAFGMLFFRRRGFLLIRTRLVRRGLGRVGLRLGLIVGRLGVRRLVRRVRLLREIT